MEESEILDLGLSELGPTKWSDRTERSIKPSSADHRRSDCCWWLLPIAIPPLRGQFSASWRPNSLGYCHSHHHLIVPHQSRPRTLGSLLMPFYNNGHPSSRHAHLHASVSTWLSLFFATHTRCHVCGLSMARSAKEVTWTDLTKPDSVRLTQLTRLPISIHSCPFFDWL